MISIARVVLLAISGVELYVWLLVGFPCQGDVYGGGMWV
jgi:hypothetical protein